MNVRDFILEHFKRPGVALDVGANRGDISRLFVELGAQTHSFEPNPELFDVLRERVPQAVVCNLAVSDRSGILDFFVDRRPDKHGLASSIYILKGVPTEKIQVRATTIDEYCARMNIRPSFIKVDVEGHEPSVFAGSRKIIEQCRPIIVFEFWETWFHRGYSDLFQKLRKEYHLIRVQDGADAAAVYQDQNGQDAVDIGCLPRS